MMHAVMHTTLPGRSGGYWEVCGCGATRWVQGTRVEPWHACVRCVTPNYHTKEPVMIFSGYLDKLTLTAGSGLARLTLRGSRARTSKVTRVVFIEAGFGVRMLDSVLGISKDWEAARTTRCRWETDPLGVLMSVRPLTRDGA